MLQPVLALYGYTQQPVKVELIGNGLINHTWKLTMEENTYILQRINDHVFKQPAMIAANIDLIARHLEMYYPDYVFTAPVRTRDGASMVYLKGEGYFRMFPYVAGSFSKDVVENPRQAYEAAKQFGRFTKLLSGLDVGGLAATIPSFHDLSLRYRQFLLALDTGNKKRIEGSAGLVEQLIGWSGITEEYERIKCNPDFKQRVTHHDTKISNVLFDKDDDGICVIDLDTVMPGFFISDVGDMMRTYLSPVSEEESDFSKISIRDAFYEAVVQGYYDEMKDELTETEKEYFFYAGTFMIYMQALRFLTDHFNDDAYYGAKYTGHNLVRAQNQAILLQRLLEKKPQLEELLKVKSSDSDFPGV